MLKRVVDAVEVLALLAVLTFVVLLFAYRPTKTVSTGPYAATATNTAPDGRQIYGTYCATCHGGSGQGGIGPMLGGGAVVSRFPNVAGEVAVVTNGRGGMPAWKGRLTSDQIAAVVAYTRSSLGR